MNFNNAKLASIHLARITSALLATFILMSCASNTQSPATSSAQDSEPMSQADKKAQIAELVDLHNKARTKGTKCGGRLRTSTPLRWNDQLATVAEEHALDMQENKRLTHTGSDGSNFAERLTQAGYAWLAAGENIAFNTGQPKAIMKSWLQSKVHCANIINFDFHEIGIASLNGYWVVLFARSKN